MLRTQMNKSTAARRTISILGTGLVIGAIALPALALGSQAQQQPRPISAAFEQVWERADNPVAMGRAQRSWLWGPKPLANLMEPLAESPGGFREVQYYDKSRMELNDPKADPKSPWYVTNGLLVYEMVSGQVQVGNNKFEPRAPARIPLAGDTMTAGPANFTPSYETLARVATLSGNQNRAQPRIGQEVNQTLSADGTIGTLAPRAGALVFPKIQQYDQQLGHNIPDVFWNFMNQQGIVYEDGQYRQGQVFNWLYTMGYPLTEPYWIDVTINNQRTQVMMQAFQRRLLTYNPANAPEWRVEMGNVGLQYYQWRYGTMPSPGKNPPPPSSGITMRHFELPEILATGQFSGIEQPLYTAVTEDVQWDALWTRHTGKLDAMLPRPKVDFSTEFVVAAFWGNQPTACYSLKIKSVELKQGSIYVTVEQAARAGACAQVVVQPNDMVAVSRAGLSPAKYNVVFVDTNGKQLATSTIALP